VLCYVRRCDSALCLTKSADTIIRLSDEVNPLPSLAIAAQVQPPSLHHHTRIEVPLPTLDGDWSLFPSVNRFPIRRGGRRLTFLAEFEFGGCHVPRILEATIMHVALKMFLSMGWLAMLHSGRHIVCRPVKGSDQQKPPGDKMPVRVAAATYCL
jgi:hypothetical protein